MADKRQLAGLVKQIATHQANLTRLSEAWGQIITDTLDDSDRELIARLKELLGDVQANYKVNTAKATEQLEYIRSKIEKIRAGAFVKAEKKLREEAPELIDNETKWSKRILSELTGEKASSFHHLTDAHAQKLLKHSIQINKTWDQWWTHTAYGDVMRIANTVNTGIVHGFTIQEIAGLIMGTKKGGYADGILSTSRAHARNLARTLCCGIANQAKDAFYRENDDIVIGVEWMDTLDGRTCVRCASMSRMRWKTGEPHPVPPEHPNCRCVLIPVTELTDMGDDVPRPAANADFNAEAKRLYETKHPGKKFDDLSESTRKKYYYEAQKEFEARTGKPAYSQVPGSMKFKDYFLQMSEQQKRDWLGKRDYELWKTGQYEVEDFIPPYPDRTYTVGKLKAMDKESFRCFNPRR